MWLPGFGPRGPLRIVCAERVHLPCMALASPSALSAVLVSFLSHPIVALPSSLLPPFFLAMCCRPTPILLPLFLFFVPVFRYPQAAPLGTFVLPLLVALPQHWGHRMAQAASLTLAVVPAPHTSGPATSTIVCTQWRGLSRCQVLGVGAV